MREGQTAQDRILNYDQAMYMSSRSADGSAFLQEARTPDVVINDVLDPSCAAQILYCCACSIRAHGAGSMEPHCMDNIVDDEKEPVFRWDSLWMLSLGRHASLCSNCVRYDGKITRGLCHWSLPKWLEAALDPG